VCAFLGTIGVCRIFIRNFAHRAFALTHLTKKGVPFIFGTEQVTAQEDLKQALLESPALRPIDYKSTAPVILAVDTSYLAIGAHLCQCDEKNPRVRYYNRFESIVLNDREARLSQSKLEIYGLYQALRKLRLYLLGVRNFVVEVDARYIKGMLQNPDIAPSASINRWILGILTFHFKLVHVPGTQHGHNGLSRRPPQPDDEEAEVEAEENEFDDWINNLYGFMHIINESPVCPRQLFHRRRISTFTTTIVSAYTNDFTQPARELDYSVVECSKDAVQEDARLDLVIRFHDNLSRPQHMNDADFARLVRYAMCFFMCEAKLWRRNSQGAHKLVIPAERRLTILEECHDDVGHKGFFATRALVTERFWWPHLHEDLQWFVQTCHYCQQRQLRQIKIPPVVATLAPLFAKAYMDTMHMPTSSGFRYIVQACCSLTHYPEFKALRRETVKTLGDWIYEDLLCR
jgi:hypothetical protein